MYCVQPSISIIGHALTAQPPTKTMRFSYVFFRNSLRLRPEHELVCSKMSSTKALVSACLAATSFCNFSCGEAVGFHVPLKSSG